MSYETAARRANGTTMTQHIQDERDDMHDTLHDEYMKTLDRLEKGDGIVATLLACLEELSDEVADRDTYRDIVPLLKLDYRSVSFGDADRAIRREAARAHVEDYEIDAVMQ